MSKDISEFVRRAAIEMAVEDIDESFGNLDDLVDNAVQDAADDALEFWEQEAGRMLNTTRKRYQESLYIYEDFSEGGVVIGMNEQDPLVLNIEKGAEPYSMQEGLLGGSELRVIPIGPPRDMRAIHSGTDPSKWTHPGFEGLDLAGETDKQLDEVIVPKHLQAIFDKL